MEPLEALRQTIAALQQALDVWKLIAYTEAAVITILAGTIVKMTHWFFKTERPRLNVVFDDIGKERKEMLNKYKDAMGKNASHTQRQYIALVAVKKAVGKCSKVDMIKMEKEAFEEIAEEESYTKLMENGD
ncbi:MAG: hypothetical protein H8D96_09305 [Desulfobacterales bacterium]|uniref:Uncharacterized protein n=1 Tax=Candidatus Desulfatibia vada TaxID=2841696 RepID=A0A8J6P486_9BACT|nr:hypothetical protein [Candidatus Desulfatibia vada]